MPSHMAKASWRDTANLWPGHPYDVALTDHYGPLVTDALLAMLARLDVAEVAARFGADVAKADGDDLTARIRASLSLSTDDTDALEQVVTDASSEAYLTGYHAAVKQLGAHAVTQPSPIADAVVDVDWGAWTAGDALAAAEAANLAAVLGDLGIVIRGIADTVLDDVASKISQGLAGGVGDGGMSSDAVARSVRNLIGDPMRADRIVHTEVARAQTNASMSVYRMSGVTEYDVLTADDADAECVEIAEAGPYALGDDTGQVPIHPFCRCANAPRVDSINADLIEAVPASDEGE